MLLVGSKYASVVAVTVDALILPDPSERSTRSFVRFAEVTVVAAPVIESSLSFPRSVNCV